MGSVQLRSTTTFRLESKGYNTPVHLHNFYSSPQHNYFTHPKFVKGDAPIHHHQSLELHPSRGIKGDRFETGRYPITLFSLEVADVIQEYHARQIDVAQYRRNIIISGVNLCELIGQRFYLGAVLFEGMAHCNPCPWMNAIIGAKTYALMKGRGGLRVKVIEGGEIVLGATLLKSDTMLVKEASEPMKISRLP